MTAEQKDFYRLAAKGYAASALAYHVDAVVHLENANDEWFWRNVLEHYHPGRKFLFKGSSSSLSAKGKMTSNVSGSIQCLKYVGNLSSRFFICVDSDYHRLLGDMQFDAQKYVLQTYTYSWENHMLYSPALERRHNEIVPRSKNFSFKTFLDSYSVAIYPLLCGLVAGSISADEIKRLVPTQYVGGDEKNNGQALIERVAKLLPHIEAEPIKEIPPSNAYLYVRGHSIFNTVVSIGEKLCEGTGVDFKSQILLSSIAFDEYDEIKKVASDTCVVLRDLR